MEHRHPGARGAPQPSAFRSRSPPREKSKRRGTQGVPEPPGSRSGSSSDRKQRGCARTLPGLRSGSPSQKSSRGGGQHAPDRQGPRSRSPSGKLGRGGGGGDALTAPPTPPGSRAGSPSARKRLRPPPPGPSQGRPGQEAAGRRTPRLPLAAPRPRRPRRGSPDPQAASPSAARRRDLDGGRGGVWAAAAQAGASSPDLVGARVVHGGGARRPGPPGSLPPPEGHRPRRPPHSRGPDLRNGGGRAASSPQRQRSPRAPAPAPPPCARPGALPHGASGGGARGAPAGVRACVRACVRYSRTAALLLRSYQRRRGARWEVESRAPAPPGGGERAAESRAGVLVCVCACVRACALALGHSELGTAGRRRGWASLFELRSEVARGVNGGWRPRQVRGHARRRCPFPGPRLGCPRGARLPGGEAQGKS